MSHRVVIHAEAHFDAIDIGSYLAQETIDVADRFVDALDRAFRRLAEMPSIGAPRQFTDPALDGIRMWPVPGFPTYLIFY